MSQRLEVDKKKTLNYNSSLRNIYNKERRIVEN